MKNQKQQEKKVQREQPLYPC